MPAPLHDTVQVPSVQRGAASPVALHTRPQAPQFDVSLFKSTQEPEQSSRSPSQSPPSRLHAPAVHTWSAAHA
jgi:hypothetical protein